ncbi:PepSY domain-containing protein [Denitromonas iodatirespirans]|uniref:PepSY domain-containing protein n=1 Tax=Denitromonas iodatirespirans TaxID=2795389 RepID=A0A944H7B9_DENI1|nr:PepSY domain-containing protein [Denitromonas iodatirespirans]MBT0961029.1 PepSY domain-containing protein [Denitromonas iodatirespirans]
MKTRTLILTLALGGGLLAGAAAVAPVFAQSDAAPAVRQDDGLSMPQIHDALTAAGYRNINAIERERNRYEVKASDADGRRVELSVDPMTGKVMKTETRRDRREEATRERRGSDGAK